MQCKSANLEESVNTKNDYKTASKNEQIKRKQTSSVCFVKVIKFKENKFKIFQKDFQEIIIIIKKISWKSHQPQ